MRAERGVNGQRLRLAAASDSSRSEPRARQQSVGFPLVATDASLAEGADAQVHVDIALVGIGDANPCIAAGQDLVSHARAGAVETELSRIDGDRPSAARTKAWHLGRRVVMSGRRAVEPPCGPP